MKPMIGKPFYTAREVVEILQKAKALGVITLTLQGFAASFDVQASPTPDPTTESSEVAEQAPAEAPEDNRDRCTKCRSELIVGSFGPYCHPCYLKRKETNYRRNRTW